MISSEFDYDFKAQLKQKSNLFGGAITYSKMAMKFVLIIFKCFLVIYIGLALQFDIFKRKLLIL